MASLLANGISRFPHQPTWELQKDTIPKLQSPRIANLKISKSNSFRVRADVGYDPKTANSGPISQGKSSPSSTSTDDKIQDILRNRDYDRKFGFTVDIDSFSIPKGLSKETIRLISSLKEEPDWMLEFRLNAFEKFLKMKEPTWSDNRYPQLIFKMYVIILPLRRNPL